MRFVLSIMILMVCHFSYGNDYLVSHEKIGLLTATQTQNYFNYFNISTEGKTISGVDIYKIRYTTVNVKGNATIASGAVFVPQNVSCDYLPLVSWQHGTIFEKSEVASQLKGNSMIGVLISATGYIVTYPDYLGLGDNEGIHPYHHGDSEATSSIDLIRATREFLKNASLVEDNNQLFISGYSQGGHATMAMHKHIQDNKLYGEFNITASAPMSGAYDMVGSQFDLIFDGDSSYYMSAFIPYLLGSYQLVYENIYEDYNQLYVAPYDQQIKEYVEGDHSWEEWSSLVPANYYNFMQDSVIQNMVADESRDKHPILKAMRLNSYTDWVPEREVKMLYSGKDSMVSPQNAIVAKSKMIALGADKVDAINVYPEGVHEDSLIPELVYALDWFDTLKKPCEYVTSIEKQEYIHRFKVYPNPTCDEIQFNCRFKEVKIYDMNGKQVMLINSPNANKINVSGLNSGLYIIVGQEQKSNKYLTTQFTVK